MIGSMIKARAGDRRGVAMLMVVIALVVTTVLSTAIMTSPDRMSPLADNAIATAEARWSAETATNYTIAAIKQDVKAHTIGGKFKDNWPVDDAMVTCIVTNMQGEPPTASDLDVLVTITANVGGIESTSQHHLKLQPNFDGTTEIDARLGEFAIHAVDGLEIDSSYIGRWWRSPGAARAPERISLGFTSPSGLAGSHDVRFSGEYVVHDGTSNGFKTVVGNLPGTTLEIPLKVPAGSKPMPAVHGDAHLDAFGDLIDKTLDGSGAHEDVEAGYWGELNVRNGAEATLIDDTFWFENIVVEHDARLIVRGDVTLVANGDVMIRHGSQIYLEPDATLRLWAKGDITVYNSVIGPWLDLVGESDRWKIAVENYYHPRRVRIEQRAGNMLNISGDSAVLADIHSPFCDFELEQSALFGRVTANCMLLLESQVFYDPLMNNLAGFSNLDGPLYIDHETPIDDALEFIESDMSADPDAVAAGLKTLVLTRIATEGASGDSYRKVEVTEKPVDAFIMEGAEEDLESVKMVEDAFDLSDAIEAAIDDILSHLEQPK